MKDLIKLKKKIKLDPIIFEDIDKAKKYFKPDFRKKEYQNHLDFYRKKNISSNSSA